jgi:release factor glutamine methyltransferase
VNSLLNKSHPSPAMFHYNDLAIELHPEVYNPAEDTFLLLESIQIYPDNTVLEFGTGCGLIAIDCARRGAHVLCTDINPFAIQLTQHNIERNRQYIKGTIEIRQGDLYSVLKENERFNLIIFNPPYLPTKPKDRVGGWFDIATDGGKSGLKTIKRFLHSLQKYLLENGRSYFIFSSLSNRSILEHYLKNEKLSYCIVAHRMFDFEKLDVYCVHPTA